MKTIMFTIVGFLYAAATAQNSCEPDLQACIDDFNKARYDDWEALIAFNLCVEEVECADGTIGLSRKNVLIDDIASKQKYWARNWDIVNASSHQTVSVITVIILLFTQSTCNTRTCG